MEARLAAGMTGEGAIIPFRDAAIEPTSCFFLPGRSLPAELTHRLRAAGPPLNHFYVKSVMHTDWPHFFRPATASDHPPLLLLHGTGGTENDLVALADRISPGSAILSPRGHVNEHGAARFFPRLGEGVFDPAAVVPRIEELAGFIAASLLRYQLNTSPRGLVALGFSNGANAAAALLQLRPDVPLAGAILLRPMVVLEHPAAPGSLAGRRVLLLNGAQDPIVSRSCFAQAAPQSKPTFIPTPATVWCPTILSAPAHFSATADESISAFDERAGLGGHPKPV